MQAIVLEIDPLPTRRLGCYGSLRAATPGFDALAAESVVFDQHIANDALSSHADATEIGPALSSAIASRLRSDGIRVSDHRLRRSSSAIDEDQVGRLTLRPEDDSRRVLHWIRMELCSEESSDVPSDSIDWLDRQIALLRSAIRTVDPDRQPLLIVFGRRGSIPTGRTEVPPAMCPLLSPHVQTPLLIRDPWQTWGSRRLSLVATSDIGPTLCEWFGVAPEDDAAGSHSLVPLMRDETLAIRSSVVLRNEGAVAIRTPDWLLLSPVANGEPDSPAGLSAEECRLYRKPHDSGDILDVSGQYRPIVEELILQVPDRGSV